MGYRFSLQHTNIIAHLIEGEIGPFFDEYFYSIDSAAEVVNSLFEIANSFGQDYYSSNNFESRAYLVKERLENISRNMSDFLERDSRRFENWAEISNDEKNKIIKSNKQLKFVAENLQEVTKIFEPCFFRTLILASAEEQYLQLSNNMISEVLIRELVGYFPEDPCLILQPKELPDLGVDVFRAFPGMQIASQDIDEWPGILLWTPQSLGTFFPVRSVDDIVNFYHEVHCLSNMPRQYMAQRIGSLKKRLYPSKKAYFLHLSDLHIGNVSENNVERLLDLVREETLLISKANNQPYMRNPPIYPLITGDLMDSPKPEYASKWGEFRSKMIGSGTEAPFVVLGNHDYDQKGILSFEWLRNSKTVIPNLLEKKIQPLDKLKIVIAKVDSNVLESSGLYIAQGQVGQEQMKILGEELEQYLMSGYQCIAMLHHHPVNVDEPSWYRGNIFRRLMGQYRYNCALKLKDDREFMQWAREKGVSLVLHGHKHIPQYRCEQKVHVLGCGSSTGKVEHSNPARTYLSYNVLKYDITQEKFKSCVMKFEDELGKGVKHLSAIPLS